MSMTSTGIGFAVHRRMADWIPDSIWKLLPDSVGGFVSLVWVVLFWALRAMALRWSDQGDQSSPHRGLLCTGAAFAGVVAFTTGAVSLFAFRHIDGIGLILALLAVPIFLVSAPCSYMLYRAARNNGTPPAGPA